MAPSRAYAEVCNLAELIRDRSYHYGEQSAFSLLDKSLDVSEHLTFSDLHAAALRVAGTLRQVAGRGDRVLLLLPAGLDFVVGIYGCWCAGLAAVPALPPEGAGRKGAAARLAGILADAGCDLILSTEATFRYVVDSGAQQKIPGRWLLIEDCDGAPADFSSEIAPHETALVQYTSGSTGRPKGVVLSHANLLANALSIRETFGLEEASVGMLWLPPHHDMGLIGGVVEPVFAGFPIYLMSPMAFLQRPLKWLEAISRYRVTTSGGPDFAYRLCVQKHADTRLEGIDLSAWRLAFCGAEKVRAPTLARFAEAFAPVGFRASAFLPCYGLAESTLLVAAPQFPPRAPRIVQVSGEALAEGLYLPAEPDSQRSMNLVSCGPPAFGSSVVVADADDWRPLPEGRVGEVLCAGPSVAQGYWGDPETNAQTFGLAVDGREGAYLRTGDLGFLLDGDLFITGRARDLIIVNGRNHQPEDLEATLEMGLTGEGQPVGAVCVFAVGEHAERITVCAELKVGPTQDASSFARLTAACAVLLFEGHGLRADRVVVVRRGAIPKTTSGKVQRHATRASLEDGRLEIIHDTRQDVAAPEAPTVARSAAGVSVSSDDVLAWLRRYAAEKLGLRADRLDQDQPFVALGLGSVEAVGVIADLSEWLGREISPVAAWEHPTMAKLAAFASSEPCAELTCQGPAAEVGAEIAIVGMACRTAGADSLDAFWKLLCEGRRPIGPVPPTRPDVDRLNRSGLQAGYLADVDAFDAAFFGISPDEARAMDPQQRVMLEVAWHALESAGSPPPKLKGRAVGVFVGISNADYARLLERSGAVGPLAGPGNALSVAANRLSYLFDFSGPSLAVDTACSSSLVATHLACQSLRAGECELALAAGVNLILSDELTNIFEAAGMLSPDARCHPFEQAANGYVRGEGCGVVVLKPLAAAMADGDRIYAVIRGVAVNQDGRSNGLTAPNLGAQKRCIAAALAAAGVSAGEVAYVEAHGTGTPLGDPIEIAGIAAALNRTNDRGCLVGSLKANVGHLESAAGILGLIKAALVLNHGVAPPQPQFRGPSDRLDLPAWLAIAAGPAPLAIPGEHAGVSSFGFGGTNAHVVLQRAPAPAGERSWSEPPLRAFVRTRFWYGDRMRPVTAARLEWVPAPSLGGVPPSSWLVVGSGSVAAQLTDALAEGAAVVRVSDLAEALQTLDAGGRPDAVLVLADTRDGPDLALDLAELAAFGAHLGERPELLPGGLRLVTQGALRGGLASQAAVWGLGRTLANEYPELPVQLLDRDGGADDGMSRALASCLAAAPNEHLLIRREEVLAGRLKPCDLKTFERVTAPNGAVLISGGMGRLGEAITVRLFEAGYRNFVLLGRTLRAETDRMEDLTSRGARIRQLAVDVADADAVRAVVAELDAACEPLAGVVHAAGVLADGILSAQRPDNFRACLRPKVDGLANLAAAVEGRTLDFFLTISSLAGVLGSPGQGSYAAANCSVDALAGLLRARGLPACALALGPILDGGMPANRSGPAAFLGLQAITVTEAAEAALGAMGADVSWLAVTRLGADGPTADLSSAQVRALAGEWLSFADPADEGFLLRALQKQPEQRERVLVDWLAAAVSGALHTVVGDIPSDAGFLELGLDSLAVLQLRSRIQHALGFRIEAAVLFEHPTIERLAAHLHERLYPATDPAAARPAARPSYVPVADEPFAETLALLLELETSPTRPLELNAQ